MEEIEADLTGRLPFTSHVSSVELMVHDGVKWQNGRRSHSENDAGHEAWLARCPRAVDQRGASQLA